MKGRNLMTNDRVENKKILIVDDEPDVLETLEDLLPMCEVVTATNFETAKEQLESQHFDITILDIMGVDGYKLLEIATKRKVIAVMLTAKALSVKDTVKSFRKGAAYYVPKDKMADIVTYLDDILEAKEKGQSPWWRWLDRFADFYERKFGPDWKEQGKDDEEAWKKLPWF
jgi:DNA-binding NtrC family response regulator